MKIFKLVVIFLVLVAFDQAIKYIIRTSGGFYICNKYFAFGLNFAGIFIISLVILIIAVFNFEFRILNFESILKFKIKNFKLFKNWKLKIKNFKTITFFSVLLILSGAVSNAIDRLHFGCVIDFIDLKFWPASNAWSVALAGWPVFNIADIYITIGAIILIIKNFYIKRS